MNKKATKIISVVLAVMMLAVYFAMGASAADVKDSVTGTYYFSYSGSNATLKKNTSSTQYWDMPETVKYNNKTYTVTAIDSYFFSKSNYANSVYTISLPEGLKSIDQGTFNTKVSYIKTIEIPGTVTTSSDYFLGCNSLKEFIVNENNTNLKAVDGVLYKGTYIQRFPAAKSLTDSTTYEIVDGTTRILTYSFHGAKYITDVKVPASVDAIRGGAFCDSTITGIHLENGSTYDVSTYICYCDDSSKVKCADRITWCLEDEQDSFDSTCAYEGHTNGLRCDITGEWLSGEVIPMKEHDFNTLPTQTEATCTKNAFRVYECAYGCGETNSIELQGTAKGHIGGTATCTAAAVCDTCGEAYGTVNASNHSFTKYTYNNDATCEKDGTKTATCDNGCGKTSTVKAENTALGHSFTSYTKSADAKCGVNAKETATCDNGCSKSDTREIAGSALSHKASDVVVSNNVAPTCENNGSYVETVTCSICGATLSTETKTVPALGHADADGDNICDNGGEALRSPEDDCTHMCHKDGFMGFLWKIVLFFQKLFKANPVCECGAAHY